MGSFLQEPTILHYFLSPAEADGILRPRRLPSHLGMRDSGDGEGCEDADMH